MRLGPKGGKGRGGARRTVRVDDGLVELARQDKVQREGHLLQRHRDRRGQHHQVGAAALDHVEAHRIGGVVHGAVDEEQQFPSPKFPRTSRSFGVEGDASSRGFAINLGVWVSSLSPRERAQAGHFCPAYASRYPCSFMNYKQGSGGWALLASAQSLSAESGNRSGAEAKAAARRTFSSGE